MRKTLPRHHSSREVNNQVSVNEFIGEGREIFVSIKDGIKHQKDYARFGIGNCFIRYEDGEWNEKDYTYYFKMFPQLFYKDEIDDDKYRVDLKFLKSKAKKETIRDCLTYLLLVQDCYSDKVLKALGLMER